MISLTKRTTIGYPIRNIFFADTLQEIPEAHPWEVLFIKQASLQVRDAVAGQTVHCAPSYTLINDLTLPEADMWKRLSTSRQKNVRRAEQEAVAMELHGITADEAYDILLRFYRERRQAAPAKGYFQMLLPRCDLWAVRYHDKVLMVVLGLTDHPARVRMMYGCHDIAFPIDNIARGRINSYVFWRLLQHYKTAGYHTFDWGGAFLDPNSPWYGITLFKQQFGGVLQEDWDIILAGGLIRPVWSAYQRRRQNSVVMLEGC